MDDRQLGALAVGPGDTDLADPEPEAPRERERFSVEGPAVEQLPGEHRLGRFGAPELEAAIDVSRALEEQETGQRDERPATIRRRSGWPWPTSAPAATREPAMTSASCIAASMAVELQRRRAVRVAEQAQVAARLEHPAANGVALTQVDLVAQHADVLTHERLQHFQGSVLAVVVDHENLIRPPLRLEPVADGADRGCDRRLLIEGRHDDRQPGLIHGRGPYRRGDGARTEPERRLA